MLRRGRFPQVSAVADGRLVIGYMSEGFWLADDCANRSFTRLEDPGPVFWESGLWELLLFEGRRVSPDGGHTWVRY